MKQVYSKNSCLTNCDKMLDFVNFENWGTNIQRGILHAMLNILSISLLLRVNDMSVYFWMQNKNCHIILGIEENR